MDATALLARYARSAQDVTDAREALKAALRQALERGDA